MPSVDRYAVMGENVGFWVTIEQRRGGSSVFLVTWLKDGVVKAQVFLSSEDAEAYIDKVDAAKGEGV